MKAVARALAAAMLVAVTGAGAQADPAMAREIEGLKAGQEAMRRELQEIKRMLQRMQAPAAAAAPAPPPDTAGQLINVRGAPFKGSADARVTIVEFSDYQCPFCARHHKNTWPQLEQEYVKTGKVKLVLRDNPLEAIHPFAFKAAEAAHCAGEQGRFWEMHDRMFDNIRALSRNDLAASAKALGLDEAKFGACLDAGGRAARIREDIAEANAIGAQGTPNFFVALTEPGEGKVTAVRVIRGAHPYAAFKEAIDGLLAAAK